MMNSTKAARQGKLKLKKSSSKCVNPPSSTSPSSKIIQEASVDNPSSPNSSAKNKQQHFLSKIVASDSKRLKENVTVTVRFRPLSPREIREGEEIAWYADGETIVRNDHIPSLAYAYDQVFGPTTTTHQVYDIAARHVVSGAMEGINGTIFAYGMTSSGKTHTMHGDQRSPGIIPLAVKDAFNIIQETPCREFLLRLSYLEIYNEVVNDLFNPAGQNLRIRENSQGTFVEGIKEEVVLSPAHALSVIAAGEEQRHIGSTNFNLHSSRSHTIFTLTIESSPCGENNEHEAVNLSQLNLIDLAGSESSKAETTGLRRKEGSYINKSLLTLGTVISKLTEGRTAHIPYRDSKLTRLLQFSLSGHGRVSLIFTVTPSSSNSEETHNTLKFAHRAKHIEIQAAQNKIIDEKSLMKKYQNEIRILKEELKQFKRGIVTDHQLKHPEANDVLLKEELEDGQVKLQSGLDQDEEEAKAALLSQIQSLTKLILVSTKSSQSSTLPHHPAPGSRYSFGEEELAYLPHKRCDASLEDEKIQLHVTLNEGTEIKNDSLKEGKKIKKPGLLHWLKPRKRDGVSRGLSSASDKSSGAKSTSTPSTPASNRILSIESRHSYSSPSECTSVSFLSEARQDREINKDAFLQQEAPLAGKKKVDQSDLLREQQRILSEKVANHFSALKRLSEEAVRDGNKESIKKVQVEMTKLNDEIKRTNKQIALLEEQTTNHVGSSRHKTDDVEKSRSVSELEAQLNDKSFELEVQNAEIQETQEQLNHKNDESKGLQETIIALKQEVSDAHDLRTIGAPRSLQGDEVYTETENATKNDRSETVLEQDQALEIEQLKQKVVNLTESKKQLESDNKRLAEESSYAQGLAAAAAIELKALTEEVVKLLNHNEKLSDELAAHKNFPWGRRTTSSAKNGLRNIMHTRPKEPSPTQLELMRELALSKERETGYKAILYEKDQRESELLQIVKESKQREAYLENEVANMWILVATLRKSRAAETNVEQRDPQG